MMDWRPRVLIVDDEPEFVGTLKKRLERRGFICHGALSGSEGVQAAASDAFDVALLDMRLPDIDGNTVLRRLRGADPGLKVVILTGHASVSTGREGLLAGASDYLIKPVEFEALIDRLMEAADGADRANTRASPSAQKLEAKASKIQIFKEEGALGWESLEKPDNC